LETFGYLDSGVPIQGSKPIIRGYLRQIRIYRI